MATQTKEALNILLKELELNKLNEKLDKKISKSIEKFFISSSFCTHTTLPDIYESLKSMLTLQTFYNENLKNTAGLAIGSVVQTYLLKTQNTSLTDSYYNLVKTEYGNCKNKDCKEFFLNSLANALLTQSISEIIEPEIEICKVETSSLCNLCLKTLRKFSSKLVFSRKLSDNLLEITQSNSSDKYEAFNLLLHNDETRNNNQVILNILLTIYNDTSDFEFTLYAYKTIKSIMRTSQEFKYLSFLSPKFEIRVLNLFNKKSKNLGKMLNRFFKNLTTKIFSFLDIQKLCAVHCSVSSMFLYNFQIS